MADLIGTATIRVDMGTAAAARSLRQFTTRSNTQLRSLQSRVSAVSRDLARIGDRTIAVTVDDRTRAGTATASAAVRSLQRLGPVRIPVHIADDTRRGARTVQATVAGLQRLGPVRIDARVDSDPAAATAAAAALRDLQTAARGTGRALGTLATRATTATAALVALGAAARTLRGDMDDLDGSVRRTGAGMGGLRGRLGTITTSASDAGGAMGGLAKSALLLAPALIPIAAQAGPIAAGLTAATAAVGVFAAAAGGQIATLAEVSQAQKSYQDAVAQHGARSQQAAQAQLALSRTMADLPHPTKVAATSLSILKDTYREWSDGLATSTMPVATKTFAAFGALFPKLTPVVEGSSRQLNRFVTIATGGIASPGFDRFMKSFADFSEGALSRANDALIRFTRTADAGQVGGGVAAFMNYARENGPLVRDTLSKLGEALGNILEAASNVGPGLLTVVNAVAGLVAAVPPGALTAMLQLAVAIKAVRLAAAGFAVVGPAMTAFAAAVGAMRTAAAGASGVLPRLGAAFMALSRTVRLAVAGTGIGLLVIALSELSAMGQKAPPNVDRLTTSLTRLGSTGKVGGEAAKQFGADLEDLHSKVSALTDPSTAESIQQWVVSLGGLADWDSTPVKNAKEYIDSIDESLASMVKDGKIREASAALDVLAEKYSGNADKQAEFRAAMDGHKEGLADHKVELEIAARAMGTFGQQAQQTSAKLAAQKVNADGLREALIALNDVNRGAHDAQTRFGESIDALNKSFKENGATLSANTKEGRANRDAMSGAAKARDELIANGVAANESLESMTGKSDRLRASMMKLAVDAFDGNKKKATEYINTLLGTPDEIKTLVKAERADAINGLQQVRAAIKETPNSKSVTVSTLNAAAIAALEAVGYKTEQLPDGRTKVTTANGQAIGSISEVSNALNRINGKTARTYTVHSVKTINEIINTSSKYRSVREILQATGGLFTGTGVRYRSRRGYADGGVVEGPGTGTSDSVYAPWLSAGEFVVNAKQTARHMPLLRAINDGRFGGAGDGMAGAGAAVGDGLAAGMGGATRTVEAAARQLAAAVKVGVREELQISSPSKAMKALAKDVGKGFVDGLTGSRAKIKSVSKDLAKDVRAAFSGRRESSLIKVINRDTGKLLSLASKRDSVAKKIADASKFATGTANQARATGSLASIVQADHFSPRYVEGQMKSSLNAVRAFTSNVQKLQKKGLSKGLLRQVLEMGPEEGGAFAKALAGADAATIKRYNKLQSDLDAQSKKLGRTGADMLYDSGKKASSGFLTGLKAQQKDIEKLMLSIAKSMQKSIKKALGIRSPSTVFIAIGRNIGGGLVSGLQQSAPKVTTAVQQLTGAASAGAPKPPGGRSAPRPAPRRIPRGVVGTARTVGAAGGGGQAGDVHYHFDVTVQNHGVLGSQQDVRDWFVKTLDDVGRTGRLPASMRAATARR